MGLFDYLSDAVTGGAARRLGGHVLAGRWDAAKQQGANMGGTPYGASIVGQAPGQPLAPNSGYLKPAEKNPFADKSSTGGVTDQIRQQLAEFARQQRAQREADLQRSLAYFKPVQAEYSRLYGRPAPGSGGGNGG